MGDELAIGELADAARRIAGDAIAEARIVDIAAVGVGGEPFARRKSVAAGVMEGEPAVPPPAHRKSAAAGADEDIRRGRARGPAMVASAAPLQRSGVFDHQEPRGAEEQRPGAEGGDAPEGAGKARDVTVRKVRIGPSSMTPMSTIAIMMNGRCGRDLSAGQDEIERGDEERGEGAESSRRTLRL